jgi:antitoxin VapB
MVVHIKDAYTDARVRLLSERRGISLTDAVKEAVDEALARDETGMSRAERLAALRQRLQPVYDRVRVMPRTGLAVDKQFYDELWGQENDD